MSNEDREKREAELKIRAFKSAAKSQVLRYEVDRHYQSILKFIQKYPEEKVEKMDWETKEKVSAEADVLFEKMRIAEADLRELDAEYKELRTDVNEFYGKEVLKEIIEPDYFEKNALDGEQDDADWWKKGD